MSHYITWRDRENRTQGTWCYFYGRGKGADNALKESLKAVGAVYVEDNNARFAIMPTNDFLRKEDYIEIEEANLKEAFRVTGYDIHSTSGVEYVTFDPMYLKDLTPSPEAGPGDNSEDYFWLNGGND